MSNRSAFLIFVFAGAICLLAGCGGDKDEPASTHSQAERDSVLSESKLPGAAAVKGALAVTDSAQARADRATAAVGK